LANTRLRYALTPYFYSLAHKANKLGEPIVAPLVYHYQTDKHVQNLGDHKMIGENLLFAASTKEKEQTKDVYLPWGVWFDFYTNKMVKGRANFLKNVPLYRNGLLQLPLYAKAGAIIPMMFVDDKTMNVLGKRTDETLRNELIIKVFADENLKEFLLYEDDGKTIHYQEGDFRTTVIEQSGNKEEHKVIIGAAKGEYKMDENRNIIVELVTQKSTKTINVNGVALKSYNSRKELNENASGFVKENNVIIIKTVSLPVKEEAKIIVMW
jgi:alpha-glucosidase